MKIARCALWLACFCLAANTVFAQEKPTLRYYLPDIQYDATVPTPAAWLGFEVGEWHVSHDQLAGYMREIARTSRRISLREYGRTHENRPLLCLTITSEENQQRIEEIRRQHQSLADPARSQSIDIQSLPSVLYQGYSIHGNEASGSNAALLVAYYLAAGQSAELAEILKNTVILLDPCFNPDGLQRFSGWVNSRRSQSLMSDPQHDEFNEPWPRGRTNHYWFDLNRDWLVAQQPESAGRVRIFHEWQPNVLTDHHEMGSNSTFFFQPGVPSRVNPLTPTQNQVLTSKISLYHAKILSERKVLFYTQENFDDFYYGKGSTYPDANGAVGILFEQASSRGSAQDTDNGLLTFAYSVRNQVFTSLSTLNALRDMRVELNEYTRDFYRKSLDESRRDPVAAYVFGDTATADALEPMLEILRKHPVKWAFLEKDVRVGGKSFRAGRAVVVPTEQAHFKLVKGMFQHDVSFSDSIFYDISAWTLPLACGLEFAEAGRREFADDWLAKNTAAAPEKQPTRFVADDPQTPETYAFAIDWHEAEAPRLLAYLLKNNVRVKVATKPFAGKTRRLAVGTLLIALDRQPGEAAEIEQKIRRAAPEGLTVWRLGNGLTPDGPDLGSASFPIVRQPKVLLVTGEGMNPGDVGEAWHALDTRLGQPPLLVETGRFGALNLSKFTHIILADGNPTAPNSAEKLKEFVSSGGTLIAYGAALKWLKMNNIVALEFRQLKFSVGKKPARRSYAALENDLAARNLPGAIFEAELDLAHPLCYGYSREQLPMFLSDTLFLERPANPYAAPAVFTEKPLMAGYVHPKELPAIGGSAAIVVSGTGRGRVICFAGDPNFRGFWTGTQRMFFNAVFFGSLIGGEAVEKKR